MRSSRERREIDRKLDFDELNELDPFYDPYAVDEEVMAAVIAAAKDAELPHPSRGIQEIIRAIVDVQTANRQMRERISEREARKRLKAVVTAAQTLDEALQNLPIEIHADIRLTYFDQTDEAFALQKALDFLKSLTVADFPIGSSRRAGERGEIQHEDEFVQQVALAFREMGGKVILRKNHTTAFEHFLRAMWKLCWTPNLFPTEALLPQEPISTEGHVVARALRHITKWVPRKSGRMLASEKRSRPRTTLRARFF